MHTTSKERTTHEVQYPLHFIISHFQPISYTAVRLFEKHLRNQSSHYEKYK